MGPVKLHGYAYGAEQPMTTIENMEDIIDAALGRLLLELQELKDRGKISKKTRIRRRDVHRYMLKNGMDKTKHVTVQEFIQWKKE